MNTKDNNLQSDERLIEIESKLAYQEDLLQSLNDIVVQKREVIDVMKLKSNKLSEQLGNGSSDSQIGESGFSYNAEDELPPHY